MASVCDICGVGITPEEHELISYYDMVSLEDGVDSEAGKVDLSEAFPKFGNIRDQMGISNLTNWKACGVCHRKVRSLLGRSEFPPKHY